MIHSIYHKATFLNDPGFNEDASILCGILCEEWESGSKRWQCDLKIRGCKGTFVHMRIDISDEQEFKNTINKVTRLRDDLNEFLEALIKLGVQKNG